jgi:hypothetical protein
MFTKSRRPDWLKSMATKIDPDERSFGPGVNGAEILIKQVE